MRQIHFEIQLTICAPDDETDIDGMLSLVCSSLDYYNVLVRGGGIVVCDCDD